MFSVSMRQVGRQTKRKKLKVHVLKKGVTLQNVAILKYSLSVINVFNAN